METHGMEVPGTRSLFRPFCTSSFLALSVLFTVLEKLNALWPAWVPLADLCHGAAGSDLDWCAGTHVKTIGIFRDSWKITLTDWRITLCSSLASNMCIDKSFPSSNDKGVLFIPQLSKVRAACGGRAAAIVIHQPWTHMFWIWIIPWGNQI